MTKAYPTDEQAKQMIVSVGHRMYQKNYVVSNDGNISCKVSDDALWTTPTAVCKGDLTPEMLVKVNLQGDVLEGAYKPSSELKMHLRVYTENPNLQAVTHAHPPAATSFAIAGKALDQAILPEAIIQLGVVPLSPYGTPGTEQVPEAIAPYCQDYQGVLLANHGALTWGADLWQAYYRMESVEYYAKVSLYTGYIIGQANYLDDAQVAQLMATRRTLGYGEGVLPVTHQPAVVSQAVCLDEQQMALLVAQITEQVMSRMADHALNAAKAMDVIKK